LDPLPGPFEILEMSDGELRELTITGFESGSMTITPRDRNVSKTVTALRLLVGPESKPFFPQYYDLTAQTLVAQVLPLLAAVTNWPRVLRITKYGVAPRARYGVVLLPGV
jgi:hypothetical protein